MERDYLAVKEEGESDDMALAYDASNVEAGAVPWVAMRFQPSMGGEVNQWLHYLISRGGNVISCLQIFKCEIGITSHTVKY